MKWLLAILLAAGCASSGARHNVATTEVVGPPLALEGVYLVGPRAGQLSASREWERYPSNRTVTRDDDEALRATFTRDLERRLPLKATATTRLRATLTLQDTAYYEGLAAETTDVTLTAELIDPNGTVYRTITLREPASAPLQRSESRKTRLNAALDRLAERLAAQL
jgi:hypothetical protein